MNTLSKRSLCVVRRSCCRQAAVIVLAVAIGCSTDSASTSCHDAGEPGDAFRPARADGNPALSDATSNVRGEKCSTPLEGDSPFGAVLSGDCHLTTIPNDAEEAQSLYRRVSLEVFFPEGRRAGARVVLAQQEHWDYPHLNSHIGELDEDGTAEVIYSGYEGMEGFTVRGTLGGPSDGIEAMLTMNIARSDMVQLAECAIRLCPTRPAPEPELHGSPVFGPSSTIVFVPTAPVDTSTAKVVATVNERAIDVILTAHDYGIYVSPAAAFPPGHDVAFDFSGTRDILGRPFVSADEQSSPLRTFDVVTDLDFDTPPPIGAVVATTEVSTEEGQLVLGSHACFGPFVALLSLPDPGAASVARFRISRIGFTVVNISAVDSDGGVKVLPTIHPGDDPDPPHGHALALPPGRPVWLAIDVYAQGSKPQSLPIGTCAVEFEDIVFE
ncbi:MAG: hypothetical protein V2A73_17100 [Pseudomonadota bacterium]